MTTAFQVDAFQNNAFQIDFATAAVGGGGGKARRKWAVKKDDKYEIFYSAKEASDFLNNLEDEFSDDAPQETPKNAKHVEYMGVDLSDYEVSGQPALEVLKNNDEEQVSKLEIQILEAIGLRMRQLQEQRIQADILRQQNEGEEEMIMLLLVNG